MDKIATSVMLTFPIQVTVDEALLPAEATTPGVRSPMFHSMSNQQPVVAAGAARIAVCPTSTADPDAAHAAGCAIVRHNENWKVGTVAVAIRRPPPTSLRLDECSPADDMYPPGTVMGGYPSVIEEPGVVVGTETVPAPK